MALSADVIDAMLASGCSAEQIAAAVKADLLRQEKAEIERKAKQAAAKREYRERVKAEGVSGSVQWTTEDTAGHPETDEDSADTPRPPCPPAPFPDTPNPTPLNPPTPRDISAPDPVREAFDEWNALAADLGLSVAQKLTGRRQSRIRARLREAGGIEGWRHALNRVRGSPFLRGENRDNWRASLDFLLQESSFTKLMEGAYDPRTGDTPDDFDDLVGSVLAGGVEGGHAGPGGFG